MAQRPRGLYLFTPTPATHASGSATPGPSSDWAPVPALTEPLPERVVVLIHGLDEEGDIWDELAPALHEAGHAVIQFDYPNDQPIAQSAGLLADGLRELVAHGVTRVDLVCHSMGGLVARDVLTRPSAYAGDASAHNGLPAADRVVMLATPNHGAKMARLEPLGEVRETIVRWVNDEHHDPRQLLGFLNDGSGEAARDLLPGSEYLSELNSRPLPRGLAMTVVIGQIRPTDGQYPTILTSRNLVTRALGAERGRAAAGALREAACELGDGVVSVESQRLPGVDDTVCICASHRGMLRASRLERFVLNESAAEAAPAIPVVLDRLARPLPGAAGHSPPEAP
jgi:pimeloyl-ACP methyl ester carboxylesterase